MENSAMQNFNVVADGDVDGEAFLPFYFLLSGCHTCKNI
jgi:hypothetical protein